MEQQPNPYLAKLRAKLTRRNIAMIGMGFGLMMLLYLGRLYSQVALVAPEATPIFVDRYGTYLAEGESQVLGFWDIPPSSQSLLSRPARDGRFRVAQALVAIEDRRFEAHGGVDFRAVVRAFINNVKGGPRQGGSTLAMQVARMQSGRSRGYSAKIREILDAQMMTWRFGRSAILHHYLKIAPQGNRMHGMAYSSRRYFQKPVADLAWSEAALLASLPKAPGRMNLYRTNGLETAKTRARIVLTRLLDQGYLDAHDHRMALMTLADLEIPPREVRPFEAYHAILRLQEQVAKGSYQQPLQTTLDLGLQQQVDNLAFETIETLRHRGAGNIAVIVADREKGDVLAYLGSDFYGDTTYAGAIDYAKTRRSSGSTLKPFFFAQGLDDGHFAANSILDDLPLHITYEGGHYTASNYDGTYLGPMLYRQALANSRNIPALEVLRKVGVRNAFRNLQRMELGDPEAEPETYGLGLAIGGLYVSLDELMGAYGTLANDGLRYKLRWLDSQSGGPQPEERIFNQATARQLSLFLSDGAARLPSFKRLNFPFPVAVKTGTSQSFRDAWALAYSRDHVVGVWIGHPDHTPMQAVSGQEAAFLVRRIFETLDPQAARGINAKSFPPPEDSVSVAICPLSGDLATAACSRDAHEYFPRDHQPQTPSGVHPRIALDMATGQRATAQTPVARIRLTHQTVLPPRYAHWASQQGFLAGHEQVAIQKATIELKSPAANARYRIDPTTPSEFQSLPFIAAVEPTVPEIDWYVNGKLYQRTGYPYSIHWPLQEGSYRIQARFPDAAVASEEIEIQVR